MALDRQKNSSNLNKTDDLVVAGVVHDLNQLFAVIMGRAGRMLTAQLDPKFRDDLETIVLAAKDASAMTRRLRGEFAEAVDQGGQVPLEQVVAQAVALAGSDVDRLKWPVSVEVPDNLSSRVPGQVLREILNNLLRNAQSAMPEGGAVSIVANLHSNQIKLLVQDQGPGLDPKIADRIFEIGFTTSDHQDKGVGLPASRMLIQSFGGYLQYVPSNHGGALFELVIPVGAGSFSQVYSEKDIPASTFPGTAVLVVDDDQAMREMLVDVLDTLECNVIAVRDAASALEQMDSNGFQIVLLDQNLPGMKGTELAEKLGEIDPFLSLILVTGWGNEDLEIDFSKTRLDLVARKPLEFGAIKDLIGQGLSIRDEKKPLHSKEPTE